MPQLNAAEAAAVLKNTMPDVPMVLFTLNTELFADTVCAALGVDFILKVDGLPKLIERVDPERRRGSVAGGCELEFRC
jgi:hypothetical protein